MDHDARFLRLIQRYEAGLLFFQEKFILRGRWSIFGFLLTKIARKSDSTQKFLLFDCKVMRLKNPVVTMRNIFFLEKFFKNQG